MDRPTPQDREMEAKFLNGLMTSASSPEAADALNEAAAEWFFDPKHAEILHLMKTIAATGVCPDLSIVAARAQRPEVVDDIIVEAGSMSFELESVASQLRSLWMRRVAMSEALTLLDVAGRSETDATALVGAANKASDKISACWAETATRTTREQIRESVREVEVASTGSTERVFSHVEFYDSRVTQYRKQVHAIGAYPGKGKTTLALQLFFAQASQSMNVLYFITESDAVEMLKRIEAATAGLPVSNLLEGLRTSSDIAKFQRAVEKASAAADNMRIFGPSEFDMTIEGVESLTRKAKRDWGRVDCIYLDYLQDLSAPRGVKTSSVEEQVAHNAKSFKRIIFDADAAGVLLSQFNRESARDNKKPGMTAFRGSGAIEHVCHLMSCLHRDSDIDDNPNQSDVETWWYSVKTRLVRHWSSKIWFQGDKGRYDGKQQGHVYGDEYRPDNRDWVK